MEDCFGSLQKLSKLNLNYNKIKELPPSFQKLDSLKILKLKKNDLKEINSLSKLSNLEKLDVAGNEIKIANLQFPKNLKSFDSSSSNLFSQEKLFSTRLFSCFYLKELDLKANKLKKIPKPIYTLSYLTTLNLSNNRIQYLHHNISNLIRLNYFDISHNRIKVLTVGVTKLHSLSTFLFHDNRLSSPPLSVILKGTSSILEWLNLLLIGSHSDPYLSSFLKKFLFNNKQNYFPKIKHFIKSYHTVFNRSFSSLSAQCIFFKKQIFFNFIF